MLTFLLFADDTNVFVSGKNLNELIININRKLTNVNMWFRANKLSLNIEKTNFMLFCSKNKNKSYSIQPSINGLNINTLTHVASTKFLGIIIDDKLNWSLHINYVASKISKNIGVISKIGSFVDGKILIMLYYSLIYPYLTYCNIAWASNYPSKFIPLLTLQKRIIRIMFRLHPRAHTKDYFISNGFLNIYQINKFQTFFWAILFINSNQHKKKLASLYLIMNITCCLLPLIICFPNLQTSTLTILDHPINSDLNFPVSHSNNYSCVVKVLSCSLLYHHPLFL